MRRFALALLLACSPAVAQTTVGTWQELAAIVNRQELRIRDLEAKVGVLQQRDADIIGDLWMGFREHNATLTWALFHLCEANAKLSALPWFTPYPIAPHACPTDAGPVPRFIIPAR